MTKLKNSNYDKTKILKLWENSKTLIVTKLKTQILTKLKIGQNKKLKLWQNKKKLKLWQFLIAQIKKKNSKTQIMTCFKKKLWQNSKTQIVTDLKNSISYKIQKLKFGQN